MIPRSSIVALAALLALPACSPAPDASRFASRAEVRAADSIAASFAVARAEPRSEFVLAADKASVSIHRSALEKEFLLQTSLITQQEAPAFNGMKSRIVAFRERGGRIYLLEATQGHTVTHELPQNLLLAEFPVVREQDGWITFDFDAGMSRLFVQGEWRASDFEGTAYHETFESVAALVSFLESAELGPDNVLSIRQIAQLEGGLPVEVKYYLTPYRPTPGYVPVRSEGFDRFGYFEVAPKLTAHGDVVHATRFDARKPIVFSVSANTPAEFKQAVVDGVLYWNKAFGREIVRAIDAPEGVVAPDARHNVIQWLTFDNAGYAYADAQADPRTGETLHAQVFMTSAFAVGGKSKARTLLRRLEELKSKPVLGKRVALRGFEKDVMCDRQLGQRHVDSLVALVRSGASDDKILLAAQDYVREVVAHEVGHTLGLRHNFAGSLASNLPFSLRDQVFDRYLLHDVVDPELVTSSSVMEYQRYEEGALTGHLIEHGDRALPYDEMAIRALYDGAEYADEEIPAFCTDTSESKYLDCRVFDAGSSVVANAVYDVSSALRLLPFKLAETYIAAKAPAPGLKPVPVHKVGIDPIVLAATTLAPRVTLASALTENARLYSVRREFPFINALTEGYARHAELERLSDEFLSVGGLARALASVPAGYGEALYDAFVTIIESESYRKGVGPYGRPYEFTDAEIETMKKEVARVAEVMPLAFGYAEVAFLTGNKNNPFVDHALGEELARVFASKIEHYVFSTVEGGTLVATVPTKAKEDEEREDVTVNLPRFAYPLELRTAAVELLKDAYGSGPDWALAERTAAEEAFDTLVENALGGKATSDFDLVKLPKDVRRWILEAEEVKGAF